VTYLGGDNGTDSGAGIVADDSSNIYVTGAATTSDFPTTANAFDRVNGSSKDAFVVKLEESPYPDGDSGWRGNSDEQPYRN
jgi:hypothetical protein